MIANPGTELSAITSEISVPYIDHEIALNSARPGSQWQNAATVTFCRDWQGKNADPERTTRVQLMWSAKTLYVRFECRYRELFLFDDAEEAAAVIDSGSGMSLKCFCSLILSNRSSTRNLKSVLTVCGSILTFFPMVKLT